LPLPEDLADTAKDHIIPRCRGGPSAPWNYQLLHWPCNSRAGKGIKLTPEAEALAAEHGIIVHIPLGDSHIADRPFTRAKSLDLDYLHEVLNASAEERDHVIRRYLDERNRST
jgi:hypothetical protein